MFCALLWKEWRELWMLPAVAGLLAALAFLLERLWVAPSLALWMVTLALLILVAPLYVPSHLYAREQEMNRFDFLVTKPLDRFRILFFRFFIGLIVLTAVWLTPYVVTSLLSRSFHMEGLYGVVLRAGPWRLTCFSLIIYVLSSFNSVVFKKQASAIGVTILILFVLLNSFFGLASSFYQQSIDYDAIFPGDLDYSTVLLLALCPMLLLASLAVFSGRSLWRQTRWSMALGYGVPAATALLMTIVGVANISLIPVVRAASQPTPRAVRPAADEIMVCSVSGGGNRILLNAEPLNVLALVDMTERKVYEIFRGDIADARIEAEGRSVVFATRAGNPLFDSDMVFISDIHGLQRERLLDLGKWRYYGNPLPIWSTDGSHMGVTWECSGYSERKSIVTIIDAGGKLLGNHEFPVLEEVSLHPIGWDYLSRFYFRKSVPKRGRYLSSYWRVRPDNIVPERVSFLTADRWASASLSPDGRWIVFVRGARAGAEEKTWLYDISGKKEFLVAERPQSVIWSRDGKKFAYLDSPADETDEETADRIPSSLAIHEPETGNTVSIQLEAASDIQKLLSWSPSNNYLLLTIGQKYYSDEASEFAVKSGKFDNNKVYAFSARAGRLEEVTAPAVAWKSVHWIADDRLMWNVKNKLIATNLDGSKPEEIFRVEGDKFFFNGEGMH